MTGQRKATAKQTWLLATLLLAAFIWDVEFGNNESANAAPENRATAAIHIVDQYGREAHSGKRDVGSETFDVTVRCGSIQPAPPIPLWDGTRLRSTVAVTATSQWALMPV
jgi:hypothetical protein